MYSLKKKKVDVMSTDFWLTVERDVTGGDVLIGHKINKQHLQII
jgi:hypothetical protein